MLRTLSIIFIASIGWIPATAPAADAPKKTEDRGIIDLLEKNRRVMDKFRAQHGIAPLGRIEYDENGQREETKPRPPENYNDKDVDPNGEELNADFLNGFEAFMKQNSDFSPGMAPAPTSTTPPTQLDLPSEPQDDTSRAQ